MGDAEFDSVIRVEIQIMSQVELPVIDVTAQRFIFNNELVIPQNIPAGAEYLCVNMANDEDVVYTEVRTNQTLEKIIFDGSAFERDQLCLYANAILQHALVSAKNNEIVVSPDISMLGVLPTEELDLTVPMDKTETSIPMLKFPLRTTESGEWAPIETIEYLVEVHETEPFPILLRRLHFSDQKELLAIDFLQYSLNSDNMLQARGHFTEISDKGAQILLNVDGGYDDSLMDEYACLPLCQDGDLQEVEPYIRTDYIRIDSEEGESIDPDKIGQHSNYTRVWFNDDGDVRVVETVLNRGIVKSEIFNVPSNLHRKVLHGYLQLLHQRKDLIGPDSEEEKVYVEIYTPMDEQSTIAVPLTEGQSKMHSTIFHIEGSRAIHQCLVLDANGQPAYRYTFEDFDEQGLVEKGSFQYDENGGVTIV